MNKKDITIISILIILFLSISVIITIFVLKSENSSVLPSFSKKIAVIPINGVIMESDKVVNKIKACQEDKSIVGIVFHINSPGGAVAPSQEIYQQILFYKKETHKPVYVSMGSLAASGGYYIASAADVIYANSGTLTGSIGVIMQFPNYSELSKKIGVSMTTITAGKLKDAGNPFEKLSPEKREYFNRLLEDTHKQFIKDVATARNIPIDSLKQYAEGEVFTGNMAQKIGLVDSIGTFEECKIAIRENNNLPTNTEFIELKDKNKKGISAILDGKFGGSIISELFPKRGIYYLSSELY